MGIPPQPYEKQPAQVVPSHRGWSYQNPSTCTAFKAQTTQLQCTDTKARVVFFAPNPVELHLSYVPAYASRLKYCWLQETRPSCDQNGTLDNITLPEEKEQLFICTLGNSTWITEGLCIAKWIRISAFAKQILTWRTASKRDMQYPFCHK